MDSRDSKRIKIYLVSSTESPEFTHLTRSLTQSSLIGLDAEWKPIRSQQHTFPRVALLQLACQLGSQHRDDSDELNNSVVFLLDLYSITLSSIWELLRCVFVSPDILKLGFRFKQDLVYLSSTFCENGCDPGFDKVQPYLDITTIYNFLQNKQLGRRVAKETKSLANICTEVLGISLSKELQCSDWTRRPLTEEQKTYAATDAQCLLEIFSIFQAKVVKEGNSFNWSGELHPSNVNLGLKEIRMEQHVGINIFRRNISDALDIVEASAFSEYPHRLKVESAASWSSCRITMPMEESLMKVVREYGEKLILKESDKKPRTSKRKGKIRPVVVAIYRDKHAENFDEWQGPPPWDLSLGGDGHPKFLCDIMVEGLAKHLRCVGMDAAVPHSRKPQYRDLINQACKEKRVLLTRDAKLLRHDYLMRSQIYRVKSLLKNEQLLEVIKTFQLEISEDRLMSRCTKCNGRFIQKPLTTEEAVEAAKGFQRIPDCLFDKNIEFWQCMDCNQLYWEGTQYHNAVQKFIDVCKLSQ
ncbi:DNA_pol_A_exo1 domain-containing protein/DUF82 domain-containing protein [Cephalotus follicularis]|uniref:DNA_pol_A_exo1 domain-containing protein/DUF82 domain-containing protein n=1 Tax=Cephalotus follicularis TaxID=3775 RepID=A0A1Q3CRS2_CEPFO|nr:DNA_pol_A_exo1 domain-containing protein/DUF82 domain-containing protein [Cephalotus follicularis]